MIGCGLLIQGLKFKKSHISNLLGPSLHLIPKPLPFLCQQNPEHEQCRVVPFFVSL